MNKKLVKKKKKAFLLNTYLKTDRAESVRQIENIKIGMNSKRTEFLMPKEHNVTITPY
jgi:hypothetical protein